MFVVALMAYNCSIYNTESGKKSFVKVEYRSINITSVIGNITYNFFFYAAIEILSKLTLARVIEINK